MVVVDPAITNHHSSNHLNDNNAIQRVLYTIYDDGTELTSTLSLSTLVVLTGILSTTSMDGAVCVQRDRLFESVSAESFLWMTS